MSRRINRFKELLKSRIDEYIESNYFNIEVIGFTVVDTKGLSYKEIDLAVTETINLYASKYDIEISEFDTVVETVCLFTIKKKTSNE